MAAIVVHHACIDYTHTPHYPAQDRNFKHYAHREAYHQQGIYIGLYGYSVLHHMAYLIRAKETEREGEDEEITQQYAQHEHDITTGHKVHGITPFLVIQSR